MIFTLSAARKAHLYALMAWNNNYTLEDAEKLVAETPYEELDKLTYAETSIKEALEGIKKTFFSPKTQITTETEFSQLNLPESDLVFMGIISIVSDIHRKWVLENAKKFNRGNEEKSKKLLFQHLPFAFIGIEEVAKDLMFIAPFLAEMGVDVGEMELVPYGSFIPSEKFVEAYQLYVEEYKKRFDITSEQTLKEHIKNCIDGIDLSPKNDDDCDGIERQKYMRENVDVLVSSVLQKNPREFSNLKNLAKKRR